MSVIDQLPEIKAIVCWGLDKIPEDIAKDSRVFLWKDFLKLSEDVPDSQLDSIIERQKPGTCCCLVYTSGTTGNPKGVMLSHDNMLFGMSVIFEELVSTSPPDVIPAFEDLKICSYLPLSHVAGMQFDLIGTAIIGAQLYFAKPDALQGTLVESLQWCRPTFFLAVPRIWEKFEDKLKEIAQSKPAILQ